MELKLKESQQQVRAKDELLQRKDDLLSSKTGEAAIHKANLDAANSERKALHDYVRQTEEKSKKEKEELESKYHQELENAGLHHQFEVCSSCSFRMHLHPSFCIGLVTLITPNS